MKIKRTIKKCKDGICFIEKAPYRERRKETKRAPKLYKTTEYQQATNKRMAEHRNLELLHNNFGNGIFITLTLSDIDIDWRREIHNFKRRLRYKYNTLNEKLKYEADPESIDCRPHFHMVINPNSEMKDLNKKDLEEYIGNIWGKGKVDVRRLERNGYYKNLADYMIKEMSYTTNEDTENEDEHKFIKGSTHSKGLEPPQAETEIINGDLNVLLDVPHTEIIDGEEYELIQDTELKNKNPFNGLYYVTYALKPTERTLQARRKIKKRILTGYGHTTD